MVSTARKTIIDQKPNMPDVGEGDRPWEQEGDFEVEDDEQDRHQIEADVELHAGVVEGVEAALVAIRQLLPPPPTTIRGFISGFASGFRGRTNSHYSTAAASETANRRPAPGGTPCCNAARVSAASAPASPTRPHQQSSHRFAAELRTAPAGPARGRAAPGRRAPVSRPRCAAGHAGRRLPRRGHARLDVPNPPPPPRAAPLLPPGASRPVAARGGPRGSPLSISFPALVMSCAAAFSR